MALSKIAIILAALMVGAAPALAEKAKSSSIPVMWVPKSGTDAAAEDFLEYAVRSYDELTANGTAYSVRSADDVPEGESVELSPSSVQVVDDTLTPEDPSVVLVVDGVEAKAVATSPVALDVEIPEFGIEAKVNVLGFIEFGAIIDFCDSVAAGGAPTIEANGKTLEVSMYEGCAAYAESGDASALTLVAKASGSPDDMLVDCSPGSCLVTSVAWAEGVANKRKLLFWGSLWGFVRTAYTIYSRASKGYRAVTRGDLSCLIWCGLW